VKRPEREFANRIASFADIEEAGYAFGSNPPCTLRLFEIVTTKNAVVPAKAGTHNHSRFW
jgi:hypothetical protein